MTTPDVYLITIDCLRPDYVGAFNRLTRMTPTLDELMSRGTIFSQCVSHAPFTTPSIASLMTGHYPLDTGVRLLLGQLCNESLPTIAQVAKRAGYTTAGFPSAFILNSDTGLQRGFDLYRDIDDGVSSTRGGCWQPCAPIHDAFERFLIDAGRDPVFCWLHYFDLHDYHLDQTLPHAASYARDVHEKVDQQCMRGLLSIIERHRSVDNAAFVITADHGECLYQHGQRGHGWHVYDSVIRVPLAISWPGKVAGEKVNHHLARHIDLLPTLAKRWGVDMPSATPGDDLFEHTDRSDIVSYAEASPRQLFEGDATARKAFAGPEMQSIRNERYKYIRHEDGRTELYDLMLDPHEHHDRSSMQPDALAAMASRLDAFLASTGNASRTRSMEAEHESAAVRERLLALGYIHE